MSGHTKHLDSFLDAEGRLTRFPAKQKMQLEALCYLAEKLEPGRVYTEPEINDILNEWHTFRDPATLRRGLYNAYLLNRSDDGRQYTVPPKATEEDCEAPQDSVAPGQN